MFIMLNTKRTGKSGILGLLSESLGARTAIYMGEMNVAGVRTASVTVPLDDRMSRRRLYRRVDAVAELAAENGLSRYVPHGGMEYGELFEEYGLRRPPRERLMKNSAPAMAAFLLGEDRIASKVSVYARRRSPEFDRTVRRLAREVRYLAVSCGRQTGDYAGMLWREYGIAAGIGLAGFNRSELCIFLDAPAEDISDIRCGAIVAPGAERGKFPPGTVTGAVFKAPGELEKYGEWDMQALICALYESGGVRESTLGIEGLVYEPGGA